MNRNLHNPTTLYERDPLTGKYKPVSEYETFDYWRYGTYIVDVRPGCTSIRKMLFLDRALAEVEAVVHRLKDKLARKICEKSDEPIKPKQKLTKKQLEAWEAWKKAFKTDRLMLKSLSDVLDESLEDLVDEVKKMREWEHSRPPVT